MLARVLATEPEVLLLDEPTADPEPAILRLTRQPAVANRGPTLRPSSADDDDAVRS